MADSDSVYSSGNGTVEEKNKEERAQIPYPKSVIFVVVTEFCERFAYYGMRAVLTIYMRNILNFSDDLATTVYHIFLLLCYFLPLFGAILADSFLGKYITVFALSSIFAIGNILLTAASTPPLHLPVEIFSLGGLLLMAIGTGGIKPCVVALGGDQFILPHQESQLKQFFSIFFFAVSVGNMVSTVITPVLRSDVQCFGGDCYPLAFGIPASLMLIAIVIFVSGKSMYKSNQPKENIILRVGQCITHAVSQRHKQKRSLHKVAPSHPHQHWIDYAHYDGSKFDRKLTDDTKGLLRVLVYYLPVPMFWALYEQLGSRWTLQATRMNGNLGLFSIKPDQMQVANAILMFIFIPIFETVLYPVLKKCRLLLRPLQRMGVGGLLAALSFFLAGYTELRIDNASVALPTMEQTYINVINTLPCRASLSGLSMYDNSSSSSSSADSFKIEPEENSFLTFIPNKIVKLGFSINSSTSAFCPTSIISKLETSISWSWSHPVFTLPGKVQSIIVAFDSGKGSLQIIPLIDPEDTVKSKEGYAKLKIINLSPHRSNSTLENKKSINSTSLQRIKLIEDSGKVRYFQMNSTLHYNFALNIQIPPSEYNIVLETNYGNEWKKLGHTQAFLFDTGGNYVLLLKDSENILDLNDYRLQGQLITIIPPNEINMLWLLPQYVVMAWAEILFIVSGMEFSFTEAPISMKSVLQSCWHLTNAAGNLLVITAAQIKGHHSQATEFFAFASLMILDIIVFAWMASRYQYVSQLAQTEISEVFHFNNQPSEAKLKHKNNDRNFNIPTVRTTEETRL